MVGTVNGEGNRASKYQRTLASGYFPSMTARRLRNIVSEGFVARYVREGDSPARYLKRLLPTLTSAELQQLCLIFTCRAQEIFGDFIRQVYWVRYSAGDRELSNPTARLFIERARSIAVEWLNRGRRKLSNVLQVV